jgi:hypothetical protein
LAEIVFGAGCPHSPLVCLEPADWAAWAQNDYRSKTLNLSDGRRVSYQTLLAENGPRYADLSTRATFERQSAVAQAALDRIAVELRAAEPDAVIVVGDDEEELFGPENQPAIAVYRADELVMHHPPATASRPPLLAQVAQACAMDQPHRFRSHAGLATELALGLTGRGVEIATVAVVDQPQARGVGHAFGFVAKRLGLGADVPIVPVVLNTYYPPNVPAPGRCVDIGAWLAEIVAEATTASRVAIIASGGLSHFVADPALDGMLLDALAVGGVDRLRRLPWVALTSGSSELLTWTLVGSALRDLSLSWREYLPVYRTPAGTGIGLAFAGWSPRPTS